MKKEKPPFGQDKRKYGWYWTFKKYRKVWEPAYWGANGWRVAWSSFYQLDKDFDNIGDAIPPCPHEVPK